MHMMWRWSKFSLSTSYCNFQICEFMAGLAAVVVIGAYMGKEIKSLIIYLFIYLFHKFFNA